MFRKYRAKRLCDLAKKDLLCYCGSKRITKNHDWCFDTLGKQCGYMHEFRSITNLELIGIINKL